MSSDARDFQSETNRLAEEALAEVGKAPEGEPYRPAQPVSVVIWIGILLIFIESLSLGVLYGTQRLQVTSATPRPNPLLQQNDCRGEIYRTYRKIVAYMKDHDGMLPKSLQDLVGGYSDIVPADPQTGRPLVYSTDGKRLSLHCGPAATL